MASLSASPSSRFKAQEKTQSCPHPPEKRAGDSLTQKLQQIRKLTVDLLFRLAQNPNTNKSVPFLKKHLENNSEKLDIIDAIQIVERLIEIILLYDSDCPHRLKNNQKSLISILDKFLCHQAMSLVQREAEAKALTDSLDPDATEPDLDAFQPFKAKSNRFISEDSSDDTVGMFTEEDLKDPSEARNVRGFK